MTRPRPCGRCGVNPVGYTGRECCYRCVPRKRNAPLVCKRCGYDDFYTAGLCRRCHRSAPLVDSCRDCLAWGVTRHHKLLCEACRGWRRRCPDTTVECPSCRRDVVVNARGYCRLCCRQASSVNQMQPAHATLEVVAINRHGQQLFFADLILKKRGKQSATTGPTAQRVGWPPGYPVTHQQLVLFSWPHDVRKLTARRLDPPLARLAAALQQAIDDHGDRHGWNKNMRERTWRGVRILLAMQDTPGSRVLLSEASALLDVNHTTVQPVLEALASVDMVDDDRQPPLETWFATHTGGLPDSMRGELSVWFHALRDGSTSPPRTRPRRIDTVRNSVWLVMPILRIWAADGHQSLREIARGDVVAALATTERRGATLGRLRSLFRYLKARKLVFTNPTARLRGDPMQPSQALPIELDPLRDALNSDDHARAALAALIAFHALRAGQLRQLRLTDIRDGRLHVDGNRMLLAGPVRERVNAWLTERARRWPNTTNPHVFITFRTAVRATPVSNAWIIDKLGLSPQKIREDRILNEAIATDGDVRRLCDLFGISVATAQRYVDVVAKPNERDLTTDPRRDEVT